MTRGVHSMPKARILSFAGSARKDSFNKQLIHVATRMAMADGADVTEIDLKAYPLPLFDEDLERDEGTPENARKLKNLFIDHDGLMISCPEYNSSITPLLKNTIDWVSRPVKGEPRLAAYQHKFALLMSASPGALGGLRGLTHVRSILSSIGVTVLPDQLAVSNASDSFDASGQLKDGAMQQRLESMTRRLVEILTKVGD